MKRKQSELRKFKKIFWQLLEMKSLMTFLFVIKKLIIKGKEQKTVYLHKIFIIN